VKRVCVFHSTTLYASLFLLFPRQPGSQKQKRHTDTIATQKSRLSYITLIVMATIAPPVRDDTGKKIKKRKNAHKKGLTHQSGLLSLVSQVCSSQVCSHLSVGSALIRQLGLLSLVNQVCSHLSVGSALIRQSDLLSLVSRVCSHSSVRSALN